MKHFLFENKDYKYSPSFGRAKRGPDSGAALSRMMRTLAGKRGGRAGGGGGDARQRCVAKAQYSSSGTTHRRQLDYIVRKGTAIDGGPAELFGTDIKEYRENLVDKNFRIFLSPENGDKIDLKELAERFTRRVELQTGYKLLWQGACHYNTAHPHAHLLVNGVDKDGNEVVFSRDVVKTFMREISRDLCTSQIGARTRGEMSVEREKELSAGRWTNMDALIKNLSTGGNTVSMDKTGALDKKRITARMETLAKLGLCSFEQGSGYKLAGGWEEDLRANGRYNTFLKARGDLAYSAPQRLKLYSGAAGAVSGKVTKIYKIDGDASDSHAVLMEGADGRAFFVPLLKGPEVMDGGKKAKLKEGDFITLKTRETQKGRLTPVIYKKDERALRAEAYKNGYAGPLAEELNKGRAQEQTRNAQRTSR
jgi:hypothetical protein